MLLDDEELVRHLDIEGTATEKQLCNELIDGLEEQLAALTGETFSASVTAIVDEEHEGTDRDFLYLNRRASALGDLKFGQDPSAPSVTLDGTDPTVAFLSPKNPRKVFRAYGARFHKGRWFVSYTPVAHLPEAAKMAVRDAAAFLWRRRGSEDALAESHGQFSHDVLTDLKRVPMWAAYLDRKRPRLA